VKLRSKACGERAPANCRLMRLRRKCADQPSLLRQGRAALSPGGLPLEQMSRLNSANRPLGSPLDRRGQAPSRRSCRSMPHTSAGPRRVQAVREYPGAAGRSAGAADGWCVRSSHCYKTRPLPPTGSRESHDRGGLSATGSALRTNCRAERIWRRQVRKRRARGNRMHDEWRSRGPELSRTGDRQSAETDARSKLGA